MADGGVIMNEIAKQMQSNKELRLDESFTVAMNVFKDKQSQLRGRGTQTTRKTDKIDKIDKIRKALLVRHTVFCQTIIFVHNRNNISVLASAGSQG